MLQIGTYIKHYIHILLSGCMNVNLRGKAKDILKTMVEKGYVNSMSEAIRMAIINFGEEHFNEVELVNQKLDKIDKEINQGKRKLISEKEALGSYAKYLK